MTDVGKTDCHKLTIPQKNHHFLWVEKKKKKLPFPEKWVVKTHNIVNYPRDGIAK